MSTLRGERGPKGDPGLRGAPGRTGGAETRVFLKWWSAALFLFVVGAVSAVAYVASGNVGKIEVDADRVELFISEVCAVQPTLAPETCAAPR